jgi:Leucine-rich repeat (LRR) protein
VEALTQLTELIISRTRLQDLSPLKSLTNLQILNIDSTRINTISALSALENLQVLHANATAISQLSPLQKLTHLKKVYADQTLIKKEVADAFMLARPHVLVIIDSKDLREWWDELSEVWQDTFIKAARIGENISKDELAKIPLLDSINVQGLSRVNSLDPLRKLQRLRVLIVNKTDIADLSPLQGQKEIRYLDISDTEVRDLSVMNNFPLLKVLRANGSKIEHIDRLVVPGLEILYADHTEVQDQDAQLFLARNSTCLLIYKTDRLNQWWKTMNESWISSLTVAMGNKNPVTSESLHRLVELEALQVRDAAILNLAPLREFVRLKELYLSGTSLTSLTPMVTIKSLKSLHAINSPLQKLDSLALLTELEDLDLSNTPLSDVYPVWKLKQLKRLNVAGTQIKRLNGLEKLERLEHLDCSNTNVSKLDALDYTPLKTLTCYNTKISTRTIENFKASHPDCQVRYYR